MAKEFAKRGHEVTIFARAFPGQPETENRDGIRIVRWGGYGLTTSLAADLVKCLFYAVGAVRRMPAGDVVVTNDFWTPALLPRLRPDAGRVFLNANRYPKHQYWLYGKVAGISAASGEVASAIERQAPKLAGRIKVVPNAIDEEFLGPEGGLGLRLRLRKFSVVSHCGKSLKVRAVGDNRPYQAGNLGNYGKKEAVMKKFFKKSLTGSVGSILFPSP